MHNEKKLTYIIIILSVLVILSIAFLVHVSFAWISLPVNSKSNTLSIVQYNWFSENKPVITLINCLNDGSETEYVLTIKNGVHAGEPQEYTLPELSDGTLEVNVILGGNTYGTFTMLYEDAATFYKNGLLIYLADTDGEHALNEEAGYVVRTCDQYVYFVSSKNKICYFKEENSGGWQIVSEPPMMKSIKKLEEPYMIWPSGWEENEWVVKKSTRPNMDLTIQ